MQIEEAKKILDDMRTWDCTFPNRIQTEAIETVLNELEKKDKVIDEIIKEFYQKVHISTRCYLQTSTEECMKYKNCYECIKQYFSEKAQK